MLTASSLEAELKALTLYAEEAPAAVAWADAYVAYLGGATAGGLPVLPAGLAAGKPTLISGLTGMASGGQGAAKLQAAVLGFWGALVPTACWAGALALVPPAGLSGLAASLQGVFSAVVSGQKDKDAAAADVSAAIHAAHVGGIVTFPPPPGGLGPQTIV
jgi:hypothetical protein